jgi:hypothetical protein
MRSVKVLVGTAVVAASLLPAATALAASRTAIPHTGRVARVSACQSDQVAAWVAPSPGGAAAGSTYYDLEFTNISTRTCTLTGYPGVSAVNVVGHTLGKPASRNVTHRVATVTLTGAPVQPGGPVGLGGTVSAILRIVDATPFPAASCGRATASGLRVYAPGQKRAKLVSLPFLACASGKVQFMSVEAVQPRVPLG